LLLSNASDFHLVESVRRKLDLGVSTDGELHNNALSLNPTAVSLRIHTFQIAASVNRKIIIGPILAESQRDK
jgi:hypothetical protein